VQKPEMVAKAVKNYGNEAVVVGIDMRDGKVAVHGWTDTTETDAVDLARKMKSIGVSHLIITDIATDGMLSGPKLDVMIKIAEETEMKVIASGGVGKLEDLALIAEYTQVGIEGAIVGRAIYEKTLDIGEAFRKFSR
jgi:phosphoribosylformimino-5-aminoimidazole carboxamide ribotide isomerase